jgi:hypothetical protein
LGGRGLSEAINYKLRIRNLLIDYVHAATFAKRGKIGILTVLSHFEELINQLLLQLD